MNRRNSMKMKTTSKTRTRWQARGMALVSTMLVLMMVLTVTLLGTISPSIGHGGIAGNADNVAFTSRRRAYTFVAQSLAESGVCLTVEWLNAGKAINKLMDAGPPSDCGSTFYGSTVVSDYDVLSVPMGDGSSGTIKVRLYPYTQNATNSRRLYVAEIVGGYMGTSQIVRVVITEKTFARYAMFSDTCPANWWVQDNTRFNGPVHINGMNAAGTAVDSAALLNILWKSASTTDIFGYNGAGCFTTSLSSSQLKWSKDAAGTYSTPTGTQWDNIMGTGTSPVTSQAIVKMPTSSTKQYAAALASATLPTTNGVIVPSSGGATTGGVFIKGDVDRIKLLASGTGSATQVMEITQTDATTLVQTKTVVTINPGANTTTIRKDTKASGATSWASGTVTSYTGATNGVVYCTGNVNGLSGIVANNTMSGSTVTATNNLSIVTDSTMSMKIDGGIVYADLATNTADPENPKSTASGATTTSGTLGLISKSIQINEKTPSNVNLTDVSIHATCFAYDSFFSENPTTRATGAFNLLGGYIVKNNGTFGQVAADSTLIAGLRATRNYDNRAANNPPPFFPSEDNAFQLTSFQRVGAAIQS